MHESGKRGHPGKIIFWSLFAGFVAEFLAALSMATRAWPRLDDEIWIALLGMVGPLSFYGAHAVSTFVLRLRGESLEATEETIWINERRCTRQAPPVEEFDSDPMEPTGFFISQAGISDGNLVRWARIKECRLTRRRDAVGNWGQIRASLIGDKGQSLADFDVGGSKTTRDCLLALHRALQPHAPEPDLSQVLGERDGP